MTVTAHNRSMSAIVATAAAAWAFRKWARIVGKNWNKVRPMSWIFDRLPDDVQDQVAEQVAEQLDNAADEFGAGS